MKYVQSHVCRKKALMELGGQITMKNLSDLLETWCMGMGHKPRSSKKPGGGGQ
jgi:hypothetical protein